MKTKPLAWVIAAGLLATLPSPGRAWVAAGGYHGCATVAYHPPCCYSSGPSAAGAAAAGLIVGAAIASSKPPPAPPPPAYVPVPVPVYYAAPTTYAPPVGTVVASLPGACTSININGVSYMNCSGVFYLPYYSGGTLLYEVAHPS